MNLLEWISSAFLLQLLLSLTKAMPTSTDSNKLTGTKQKSIYGHLIQENIQHKSSVHNRGGEITDVDVSGNIKHILGPKSTPSQRIYAANTWKKSHHRKRSPRSISKCFMIVSLNILFISYTNFETVVELKTSTKCHVKSSS